MNTLNNIRPFTIHVCKIRFFQHAFRTWAHFAILVSRFDNVGAFYHFSPSLLKRGRFLAVYGQGVNNPIPKTNFAALFATQPLMEKTICENLKGIGYEF